MLNFQAALLNVNFENDYKNVLRFDNREAQESYFNCASLFLTAPNINFKASNLFETTIDYTINENESINELLSKNYCIIKDNSPNKTYTYYYYFIKNSYQNSGTQIRIELELDIFNTYYIDLEFTDCQILRAHLNRFIDNGDGTVSFDGTPQSKLFEREPLKELPQRTISRTKLNIYTNLVPSTTVANWLNNNVICWKYIYLASSTNYKTTNLANENIEKPLTSTYLRGNDIDGNTQGLNTYLTAMCVPVLRSGVSITIKMTARTGPGTIPSAKSFTFNVLSDVESFINKNSGFSYIYATKLSPVPPFDSAFFDSNVTYSAGSTSLEITIPSASGWSDLSNYNDSTSAFEYWGDLFKNNCGTHIKTISASGIANTFGVMFYVQSQQSTLTLPYTINNFERTFNKSIFTPSLVHNIKFNPKLYSSDFKSLDIGTQVSKFNYDIQKLNDNELQINYTEPLVPDITKSYTRYSGKDNSVYLPLTSANYTGDVGSNDTSLIQVTSQYQQMLANNKNYFLQNSLNRNINFSKGIVNNALGGIGNGLSGNWGGVASNISGLAFAGVDMWASQQQEAYTVDNMKSAPQSITNAQGNAPFNFIVSGIGIYAEEQSALQNELEAADEFMLQYGYTVNRLGNIKDYDNIRTNYNYLQAELQEIKGVNISNIVRNKFVAIFQRGVRLWNNDSYSFKFENYENWLKEG